MLNRIQSLLRQSLAEILYAARWKLGARAPASRPLHQAIFTRIHATNAWGDPESRSGSGSTLARGTSLRPALLDLLTRYSVSTLLDAPCGDFNWMRQITAGQPWSYVGVDVVGPLIDHNKAAHADDRHDFQCLDLTSDPLPRSDLILCRDALVHLSFADIESALENFKRSGSRFLLATTFIDLARNDDIRTGGWRPLNLQIDPFFFPEPVATIEDCPPGGIAPGKRLVLWELASIEIRRSSSRGGQER